MQIIESSQAQLLGIFEKGAARSTEKLAKLSGSQWAVHIVSIDVGSGGRFRSIMARDRRDHVGFCFSSSGERYLVLFTENSGKAVLDAYAHDRAWAASRRAVDKVQDAALAEIANVIINGLSGELADRQGMTRIISAPKAVRGVKLDLFNEAFSDLAAIGEESIVDVMIHISSPALDADCTLMLRLDTLSANFLLRPDPDARP